MHNSLVGGGAIDECKSASSPSVNFQIQLAVFAPQSFLADGALHSRGSEGSEASTINTRTNYHSTLHLSRYAIVYLQSPPHPPPDPSARQPDETQPECCSPLRFRLLFSSFSPPIFSSPPVPLSRFSLSLPSSPH